MKQLFENWRKARKLLQESPESLGFSEKVGELFREKIPDNRKARHRLAQLVKNYETEKFARFWKYDDGLAKLAVRLEAGKPKLLRKLAKNLGIRGYDEKTPDELYDEFFLHYYENFDTVDDFRIAAQKIKKLLEKEISNRKWKKVILYPLNATHNLIENLLNTHFKKVVKFLNRNPNNYKKLKGKSPEEAIEYAEKHDFDKDKVIHEFDDGYFWYGPLSKEECEEEGEEMSHCGGLENKTYSLRNSNNSSKVTLEFEKERNVVKQIKGSGNTVPKKEYWPYIEAWVDYWNPQLDLRGEYRGGPDKHEFIEYIAGQEAINLEDFARKFMIKKQEELERKENLAISEFNVRRRGEEFLQITGMIRLEYGISKLDDKLKQKIQRELDDQRLLEKIFQFENAYGLDSENAGARIYDSGDTLFLIFPFSGNFQRRQAIEEQIGGWLEEVKYSSYDMLKTFVVDYDQYEQEELNESKIHIKIHA